jgi:hypothetical protein
MPLESIHSLAEMSIRVISWGKGGGSDWLKNLAPSCVESLEMWEPHPPRNLKQCPGLYRDVCTFIRGNE